MTLDNSYTHLTDSPSYVESKNNFNHETGRPSLNVQLEIEITLRPYFENSISAPDSVMALIYSMIALKNETSWYWVSA